MSSFPGSRPDLYALLARFCPLSLAACCLYISFSLSGCSCHLFPNFVAVSAAVQCGFDFRSSGRCSAMNRKKAGSGRFVVLKRPLPLGFLRLLFLTPLSGSDALPSLGHAASCCSTMPSASSFSSSAMALKALECCREGCSPAAGSWPALAFFLMET